MTDRPSNHTPGPWTTGHGNTYVIRQDKLNGRRVAELMSRDAAAYDEAFANAKLIAAAPELLEALRCVLRVADRATDEFDAARSAIAKAVGHDKP